MESRPATEPGFGALISKETKEQFVNFMSDIQHLTLQGKAVRAGVLAAAQLPQPVLTMRAAFLAILSVGLLSFFTPAAHAGVTYDNGVKSGFQWGVTTITTPAFTIGSGANRAAMIMVTMSANNATNITAILSGVNGTLIPGTDSGTTATLRTLAFQVINPPSGSQAATVSWTTSMNADIGVITVSGADQTTPCTNGTFAAATDRKSVV